MSADRETVLKVLKGHSPDYFIFPNASAFYAEELDPDEVAETLDELHNEGLVEREQFVVEVTEGANDGAAEIVPGGYRLTPQKGKGKKR